MRGSGGCLDWRLLAECYGCLFVRFLLEHIFVVEQPVIWSETLASAFRTTFYRLWRLVLNYYYTSCLPPRDDDKYYYYKNCPNTI